MGLSAVDYALRGPVNPSLFIITGTGNGKLSYARERYPSGPQTLIHYPNAADVTFDTLTTPSDGHGSDDIFVFMPNEGLVTLASSLLSTDGCLNSFAGPQDKRFSAPIDFYDMYCAFIHYVGISGDNTDDMHAVVELIEEKKMQAAKVVTHILGLNAADRTMLELPAVGDSKKLVHTGGYLPLISFTRIRDRALAATLTHRQGI